ncbi:hypothetical protein Syun_017881 [Stephania yunnanensis]|uniref:RRM domain-containing protein n=1 Tax=Stephania yunnanensis TaxID=152371 RepID=A0AAP0P3T1_9MAGN
MAKKRKLETKSVAEPANTQPTQPEASQTPAEQETKRGHEEIKPENQEIKQEQPEIKSEQHEEGAVDETEPTEAPQNDGVEEMNDVGGEEEEKEEEEEEPIEKLLEPFTKEQLFELLCSAAESHSDVLDKIRSIADVDPVHRKIFVHGLGWDTNAETLINAFKEYGEIEDCKAVADKISGKSKGYGFILFKRRSGARKALKEPQKKIGNRMTACQLAAAGPVVPQSQPPQQAVAAVGVAAAAAATVSEYTQRKIYVSNVSADIDPQKLLAFFAKYGEIVEGPLGLDKQTGKPKGFALFVYKTVESARKALEEPHKNFEGHILNCQRAIDGPKHNKMQFQIQSSGGGGIGSQYGRSGGGPGFPAAHGSAGDVGGGHHMMAPTGVHFNQGGAPLNPVLGQALTALLAGQGGGLGLNNILGTIGSSGVAPMNQSVPAMVGNVGHGMQGGYGNQASSIGQGLIGGYGNPHGVQGGYPNPQMGQGGAGRSQGAGHMGGVAPYMGH